MTVAVPFLTEPLFFRRASIGIVRWRLLFHYHADRTRTGRKIFHQFSDDLQMG
jgi:hypothetical protein